MKHLKFSALMVAVVLVMSLAFTGCWGNDDKSSSSSSTSSSSSSKPSSSSVPSSPSSSTSSESSGTSSGSSSTSGSGTSTSSSVAAMGTDFEEIGALPAKSLDWGPGGPVDKKNRSQGALQYNEKFGKYDAVFIAPESPNIYLTFDEGYEYGLTPTFLDILKEKDVKALFFITYDFANREKELCRRMIDEGHVIGNHSWSHKNYSTLTPKAAAEDLMKLHDFVKENFQYEMKYFRFPSGNFNEQTLAVVQSMGYKSLFWSFAYKDWLTDAQPQAAPSLKKIVDSCHPGAIYLLHSVSKTNADVLAEAIDQIRAAGYVWADPSTL